MTYPTFPTDLPKPLQSGYTATRASVKKSVQGDKGPPRGILQSRMAWTTHNVSLRLTAQQHNDLQRFFIEDLDEGSSYFWMRHPVNDGAAMTDEDGEILLDEDGAVILHEQMILAQWSEAFDVGSFSARRPVFSFVVIEQPL
ncbi:hypothetical protein Q4543_17580 [Salipiger sp. 1_MG-2023]|uniref:hypothetical protein n=1 Tax=Salipiger sp. 1_MG-2023 TaxID=3062665 RepID=UPI0026E22EF9|nr:hypothetical protein [Salipiger sp. 1_MG-2023]MDO6587326.1 hypothetical protein [Salipiger sp. 1_MG-2023]